VIRCRRCSAIYVVQTRLWVLIDAGAHRFLLLDQEAEKEARHFIDGVGSDVGKPLKINGSAGPIRPARWSRHGCRCAPNEFPEALVQRLLADAPRNAFEHFHQHQQRREGA